MFIYLYSISDFFSRLFPSYSKDAYDINVLFLRYLIFASLITALIGGIIIIIVIRFRSNNILTDPDQVSGNKWLEIAWTVIPLIIVTFFFFLTLQTLKRIDRPHSLTQKPDVLIIGRQWWWNLVYLKEKVITANELHIPVGKQILMRVESDDVIHDWWVPDLGPKIDAIPGQPNYTWISADKPGTYLGTCSEYCGIQHAWMRISVIAQTQDEYEKWVKSQQKAAQLHDDTITRLGNLILNQKSCLNCHSLSFNPDEPSIRTKFKPFRFQANSTKRKDDKYKGKP